jgi:hypothetical protein
MHIPLRRNSLQLESLVRQYVHVHVMSGTSTTFGTTESQLKVYPWMRRSARFFEPLGPRYSHESTDDKKLSEGKALSTLK